MWSWPRADGPVHVAKGRSVLEKVPGLVRLGPQIACVMLV